MRIRARSGVLTGSRGLLPVAAALVPVLALTAACGSSKKPLTPAQQITKSLLTSKDVPHVAMSPSTATTQLLGGAQRASRPDCQPLADQWSSKPSRYTPLVYTGGVLTDTAAKDKNAKTISLEAIALYKPGQAKSVLDALAAALRTCHGYSTTRGGATSTFTVTPGSASGPRLGDQQVVYTVRDPKLGASGTVLVTVVRAGDATAAYETVRADHKAAALRPAIALKQTAKLRAEQKAG
ncbi:sensor domain-containing protein [Actinacidiphila guanduensis]|uniref:PknH-like extracellular domain-containing protein n=1 Tax=Actinacidiphila guanduensis TaxID=310781 RepID=A0A1H0EYS0_9ACTN|nr:sensor domain-containing protein [Actinacidiphila guanduensis]SDN87538.1 PknH-like extracellular domain-containing protein [Actinacidiphila guanduensis]